MSLHQQSEDPIKVGLALYPADLAALDQCLLALKRAGVEVAARTLLRALVHLTDPLELYANALLLAVAQKKKNGPKEEENVVDRPGVWLTPGQVKKLDGVVRKLDAEKVTATRSYVVRATLRVMPDGVTLAPQVKKYLAENPPRPRGWQVAGTWKAKPRG